MKTFKKKFKVDSVIYLKYKELTHNPAQPNSRLEEKRLNKELENNLYKRGQIEPINITSDGQIINGHRRAAILNKFDKPIKCLVIEKYDGIFNDVNQYQMKMSDFQCLETYNKGYANEIKLNVRKKIEKLERLDKRYPKKLEKAKIRPSLAERFVTIITDFCKNDSLQFKKQIMEYILKYPSVLNIKDIIPKTDSVNYVYNSIRKMKKMSFDMKYIAKKI